MNMTWSVKNWINYIFCRKQTCKFEVDGIHICDIGYYGVINSYQFDPILRFFGDYVRHVKQTDNKFNNEYVFEYLRSENLSKLD